MFNQKDHYEFVSVNTTPQRAYYVPFSVEDKIKFKNKIIDRSKSSRFISLDGKWKVKRVDGVQNVDLNEKLNKTITVPSCVQIEGLDGLQYINDRYPFFYEPPFTYNDSPVFHYRKTVDIKEKDQKYYLVFEGVDSGFYLFVNKVKVGYGQIAHSTNEFDITDFVKVGENVIDVIVLKWTASSYLECQDKLRFSGIFRSAYILKRPKEHITDYKIKTDFLENDGFIYLTNLSEVDIEYSLDEINGVVKPNQTEKIVINDVKLWTAENPNLYTLTLISNGEKILERVGVRTVKIDGGVFKINGKHLKLKGVNRHDFNTKTGMTVSVEDIVKDFELMKWANVNAVRTSHYPNMPEFYNLADEYGLYIVDEADVETHGQFNIENNLGFEIIKGEANNPIFFDGVYQREVALYERDKNRTSVIMWSLGNESSFGKMFYKGIEYIKSKDDRPVHYQGIETLKGSDDYYTDKLDVLGTFYPPLSYFDDYLKDEKEVRPLMLCEYLHAMGNSCGGLEDYWEILNSNDRFIGAFVWEWCDHGITGKKGFLYGGDFGEEEHDLNFCIDGLVTPDRKVKSNLLEVKSVYGNEKKNDQPVKAGLDKKPISSVKNYEIDREGRITSLNGSKLKSLLEIQLMRAFTDNDGRVKGVWERYLNAKMQAYEITEKDGVTKISGRMVKNCFRPLLRYELTYTPFDGGLDIGFSYEVNGFIDYLPRIGLTFAVDSKYSNFEYLGYGPTESYVDKHASSYYGEHKSSAKENYYPYIKPQESGSHYNSTKVVLGNKLKITAESPFSFSVLPYSVNELMRAKHDFELKKSKLVYVNLDLAMSGIGTASCGPELPEKYRAAKSGNNTFRIEFLK